MDEDQIQTTDGKAWWENTIDFVVRSAATKQFSTPRLQNGQTYYVDQYGNVLPAGQNAAVMNSQAVKSVTSNPLVMMAVVALGAVLLFKLAK